jgi:hypothetical protein
MALRAAVVTIILLAGAPIASAEDCRQYPPGPVHFECVSRKNPRAGEKLERCRAEAAQMGLKPRGGANGGGRGMRPYVQACMLRR